MGKKKIDNPKVFISYAWGDDEYQSQVLAFASQLVGDGVQVVFDKWDLTEGNDTYAFMEKCATDPTITNVLMLLDPIYAKKADEHTGGVGAETQIISAKVYQEVSQDKFIPVVMKRDEEGGICKPTYLQGRLHFDLSLPDSYDDAYQRLVKKLYGVEIYEKPPLGKKPKWVETTTAVTNKSIVAYNTLQTARTDKEKQKLLTLFLSEITNELIGYVSNTGELSSGEGDYITWYDDTASIKMKFLQLLKSSFSVDNSCHHFSVFFEDTTNNLPQSDYVKLEIAHIRIHELFLYTIAYFLKCKDYSAVGYMLGKTYFNNSQRRNDYGADNYSMFYSGQYHQSLDNAVNKRDDKAYFTGTGSYWIETMATDYCSKEQFVLADLVCYNYSIYGRYSNNGWPWFPITYVYDNRYSSVLGALGKKMVSYEYAIEVLPIFGYERTDELIIKMDEVEKTINGGRNRLRYSQSFESAPLLRDFIQAKDIGSMP